MISRDLAAQVRYDIYVSRRPTHAVTMDANITTATLTRVLEGYPPPPEERVVISPNFSPRNRKLTAPQRVRIAHLLCYGATLQGLANEHDVRVRSIQHIKDAYTARVGESTQNSKTTTSGLNHNMVAESRYRHEVLGEAISLIAARLFLNYKSIYRAVKGKTYRTNHGLQLTMQARGLDAESPSGKAVRLYLFGADEGFISDSTDLDQETVRTLVASLTESAA